MNPLVPQIPGFGAILCTFMEDPFCNFSFKIGQLDVMVSTRKGRQTGRHEGSSSQLDGRLFRHP